MVFLEFRFPRQHVKPVYALIQQDLDAGDLATLEDGIVSYLDDLGDRAVASNHYDFLERIVRDNLDATVKDGKPIVWNFARFADRSKILKTYTI